ncbi:WhiB family transcriptional regulator [Rhodococcus pyridinivorans]|uniref:WhiB family transcriptional regulator n=1 Tax=Rhodococcus pyridinivorans TaxID=103816 RepID=UPI0020C6E759|nr:WhiB family transcriptional regulator [Rhodococcus pyridinivorans]UTM35884.1 WhiB family transcriptional regulator [Rhodococcus pyridinivorans]
MRTDILSRSDTFAVSRADRDTLPCHENDPDLWFAETPADLEYAKTLCAGCPVRAQCLDAALEREEPWGVWGGEIIDRGVVVARKRPRGRPRKNPLPEPARNWSVREYGCPALSLLDEAG